jgi:hypothetical protein
MKWEQHFKFDYWIVMELITGMIILYYILNIIGPDFRFYEVLQ